MNLPNASRLGAACGAVFAVMLFVAAGNGSQSFDAARAVAGLAALALFIPFLAYLSNLLRAAEGRNGWLSHAALAGGVVGITVKIVSTVPELALHHAHVADGTALHKLTQALADGATVMALFPFAVFCGATALVAFRTAILPRWLAAFAAVTAAALAVNGAFLEASFVPALLLLIAWCLVASLHLLRRTWRAPSGALRLDALTES
jgi:hypothetical protein